MNLCYIKVTLIHVTTVDFLSIHSNMNVYQVNDWEPVSI